MRLVGTSLKLNAAERKFIRLEIAQHGRDFGDMGESEFESLQKEIRNHNDALYEVGKKWCESRREAVEKEKDTTEGEDSKVS